MVFPFYIARRYLISKKSHNIINIIAGISVAGVTVGTMALIVILSVFNGFEDLVKSLYSSFDPAIKISAAEGKTFGLDESQRARILQLKGVNALTDVVQENVLLKYKQEQNIVTMKGVSPDFLENNALDTMLVDGDFLLQRNGTEFTIMGYLVAYTLGVKLYDNNNPVVVYVPKRGRMNPLAPDQNFNTGFLV
ncbi:MAG: ABC transporter permease, partial [Bacteroidales bacterium]|nr:ABC transporter permease [Bacteroidales bacterium]